MKTAEEKKRLTKELYDNVELSNQGFPTTGTTYYGNRRYRLTKDAFECLDDEYYHYGWRYDNVPSCFNHVQHSKTNTDKKLFGLITDTYTTFRYVLELAEGWTPAEVYECLALASEMRRAEHLAKQDLEQQKFDAY